MCTGIAPDCYLQIGHVYGELLPRMLQHAPSNLLLAASNLKGSLGQYDCSSFYGTLIFKLLAATFRLLMCTGNCSQDCSRLLQAIYCLQQAIWRQQSRPDSSKQFIAWRLILLGVLEILLLSIFIACRPENIVTEHFYCLQSVKYC